MPETYATIGFAPIGLGCWLCLARSDGRQYQCDSIQGNLDGFRLGFGVVSGARFRLGFAVRWYLIRCQAIRLHTAQSRAVFGVIWRGSGIRFSGRFCFAGNLLERVYNQLSRQIIIANLKSTGLRSRPANSSQTQSRQ